MISSIYQTAHSDSAIVNRCATAKELAENIALISPIFTVGEQEDPSEFFIFLLQHLTKCLCSVAVGQKEKPLTSIQKIFALSMQQLCRCSRCHNVSIELVLENTLSISIIGYSNIQQALANFFAEHALTGDDSYQCNHCAEKVPGTIKFEIVKESPILVITLKRFSFDQQLKTIVKINDMILYPEKLNLNPFLTDTCRQSKEEGTDNSEYKLYAVLVHKGATPISGHVFAFVHSPDGYWYQADDKSITRTSLNVVLNQNDAYVLCYAKGSTNELTMPPSGISSSMITSTPIISNRIRGQVNENFDVVRILDIVVSFH